MNIPAAQEAFGKLLEIIVRLRSPGGCPWDREQTPMTLRSTFTEETYELIHAIQENDQAGMREELGDVFLNASMIGEMKESDGSFTLEQSLYEICEKLIRRHPHVFGSSTADTAEAVLVQWEEIKALEKKGQPPQSLLHKAGRSLPPLEKSQEIQKKAAKVGFDWPDANGVVEKIREELDEVLVEMETGNTEKLEAEIGDLLFAVVNLARFSGINASLALNTSVEKFKKRFLFIEQEMAKIGLPLGSENLHLMEKLWNQAKRNEAPTT